MVCDPPGPLKKIFLVGQGFRPDFADGCYTASTRYPRSQYLEPALAAGMEI